LLSKIHRPKQGMVFVSTEVKDHKTTQNKPLIQRNALQGAYLLRSWTLVTGLVAFEKLNRQVAIFPQTLLHSEKVEVVK